MVRPMSITRPIVRSWSRNRLFPSCEKEEQPFGNRRTKRWKSALRFLLDLGRVEQGGDDRRRADADRDSGLHQLAAALLVGALRLIVAVGHVRNSMAFGAGWEAA